MSVSGSCAMHCAIGINLYFAIVINLITLSMAHNLGVGAHLTFQPIPHCIARVLETEILGGSIIYFIFLFSI